MNPIRITGATRDLGAPPDWDPAKQGSECSTLAVRDTGEHLQSAWIPCPDELEALARGAPVILTIWGRVHPVVSLGVEEPQTVLRVDHDTALQALGNLVFMARTAGGTAGRDEALIRACEAAEAIIGQKVPPCAKRKPEDQVPPLTS